MVTENGLTGKQAGFVYTVNDFTHNHVLRKIVSDIFGDEITWSGLRYTKTYTFKLDDNWNIDNLNVVAFIGHAINDSTPFNQMDVTNANDLSFRDMTNATLQLATGINEHQEATRQNDVYSVSGIRLEAPVHKGIYIMNGHKYVKKSD